MTAYVISFGPRAMDHIPGDELTSVADAAHAVIRDAIEAGVHVFSGALVDELSIRVRPDGSITPGTMINDADPDAVAALTVVEVSSRAEALAWAARLAAACRCEQVVREVGADPVLDAMLLPR